MKNGGAGLEEGVPGGERRERRREAGPAGLDGRRGARPRGARGGGHGAPAAEITLRSEPSQMHDLGIQHSVPNLHSTENLHFRFWTI